MSIRTLFRFLFGNREAILQIASTREVLLPGLLFVLSAGFAREYDREDLLSETWHLLLPLAASLGSCLVLFLLVEWAASRRKLQRDRLPAQFRRFLGLYWMTAPLAWLYAIPVERFLSAPDAVAANLWLLGIVATWRVALMIRVISVLYGTSIPAAFSLVFFFADTVALVLTYYAPVPVISVMGGTSLSQSELILQQTAVTVAFLGGVTWPVWFVAATIVLVSGKKNWHYAVTGKPQLEVHPQLYGLAVVSLLVWILILPITQPELRLRGEFERHLNARRIAEGLALTSEHGRDCRE